MGDKIDVDLHNISGIMNSIMGQMGISGGPKGKSSSAPAGKGKSGGSKAKTRRSDKPVKSKGKAPDKSPPAAPSKGSKAPGGKVPVRKPQEVNYG